MAFKVHINFDGKPHGLSPDISEAETYALGRVTSSWALLEYLINATTICLAEKLGHELPENFLSEGRLRTTLNEFEKVINLVSNMRRKEALKNILSRTKNLKADRHDLSHAIWEWDVKSPHKVTPKNIRKEAKQPKKFDFDKIMEIADKIEQVCFDLRYPLGKKQFYKEKAQEGNSFSREFAIIFTGVDSSDPTLDRLGLRKEPPAAQARNTKGNPK